MGFCDFLSRAWNVEGLSAIVAVVLSLIIEYIPAYNGLLPKTKQLIYLGICGAIGFGFFGAALIAGCQNVATWWDVLVIVWMVFRAGIPAVGAGTMIHAAHAALKRKL